MAPSTVENTQDNTENDPVQPHADAGEPSTAPNPPPVALNANPAAVENDPPNAHVPTWEHGESATSVQTSWTGLMDHAFNGPTPPEPEKEKKVNHKNSGTVWFQKFYRKGNSKPTRADTPEPFTPHIETIMDDVSRGAPTNGYVNNPGPARPENVLLSRQRSQYYSDVFAVRESPWNVRNKVNQNATIVVTITTNVCIEDTYGVTSDLSSRFAVIFSRSETTIMVIIQHHALIMLGGAFDPAYRIDIAALPSLLAPTTNRRYTMLVQTAIYEIIGIPPRRGVVSFTPIPEENLAYDGKTIRREIEDREKEKAANDEGIVRTLTRSLSRRVRPSLRRMSTAPSLPAASMRPRFHELEHSMSFPLRRMNTPIKEESSVPGDGDDDSSKKGGRVAGAIQSLKGMFSGR